jgi:hypothetical protein
MVKYDRLRKNKLVYRIETIEHWITEFGRKSLAGRALAEPVALS